VDSRKALAFAIVALVVGVILTQDLIDLELSTDIGAWHANAPIADLLALALLPLALFAAGHPRSWPALPAPVAYGLFVAASLASVATAVAPADSIHHVVRKTALLYLLYGVGLSVAVARVVPAVVVYRATLVYAIATAVVSLGTSVLRVAAGDALWFTGLQGITPNHKTLALALSAWVPWLLLGGTVNGSKWPSRIAVVLVAGATLLSFSKSGLIAVGMGLLLLVPRGRPIGLRPKIIVPAMIVAYLLSLSAPLLLQSKTMLDAARSRQSLNVRAWEMFEHHPLTGSGSGGNVVYEMVTFPHYRVNGIDAHGVIQKIASETGLLGLLTYGAFVVLGTRGLWRRWDGKPYGTGYAELVTWGLLHLNLLLSTETFSPTHWIPLGVVWGTAVRRDDPSERT
jgi:O-antigen ligase